jgi:glyoxylase-like metal-dependent hydrolase (beta-lactamase superfamily II)
MKLTVIDTGFFKLDGGAMFGVVPKSIWEKLERPDDKNLCTWAMRCLLIETDTRKILVDTGIGNKQTDKFFSHYDLHGEATLLGSLANAGVSPDQITDVFCTHFHFDHIGGGVNRAGLPTFPNARYWTNQAHYDWAANPNPREAASFLKENFVPLRNESIMQFLPAQPHDQLLEWLPEISVQFVYGHTEAMMLPHIHYKGKTIIYCADLLPSPSHLGLPYVMGYDTRPLETMKEKSWLLDYAEARNHILFFEHAPKVQACTLKRDEKGRIVANEQGDLSQFLNS